MSQSRKRNIGDMNEPTYNYRGYEMRSIAEARWAAFFDICEIQWQYEPLNTGSYIPDFLLFGDDPTLVEIKGGATTVDQLIEQTEYITTALTGYWDGHVLCFGANPILGVAPNSTLPACGIRWTYYPPHPGELEPVPGKSWGHDVAVPITSIWCEAHPGEPQKCLTPTGDVHHGFCDDNMSFHMSPQGCYNGGSKPAWPTEDIEAKWAEATNRVKYRFGGSA